MNRMNIFAAIFAAFLIVAYVIAGDDIASRLYQMLFLISRLSIGFFIGYYGSKAILKDFRPENLHSPQGAQYMQYRAIIVAGGLIGAGMAV